MAFDTKNDYRNQMIYSIYVRNHTSEGTFQAIIPDLDRIRSLGTDIIWLLPIHPIGVKGKKGSLGCPYAIADYRGINPAYGTKEDFLNLVDEIHKRGMKCIIDVVYNHTSQDSILLSEHPEFFYRKEDGNFGNRCGEWEDVYDLDYADERLWDYQIETLKMWAAFVDGFRCDVASCVPAPFWAKARTEVAKVRKDCLWLAESVHAEMVRMCRQNGLPVWTDDQLYEAFDLEYPYDIIAEFEDYLAGKGSLMRYLEALNRQEILYPLNYNKMRFLENHDTIRFASRRIGESAGKNWRAFMFFQKGTMQIYAGEERCDQNRPSLFEVDPVNWEGEDLTEQIRQLAAMKKLLPSDDQFQAKEISDVPGLVYAVYQNQDDVIARGWFALEPAEGMVKTDLQDGVYENLADGKQIIISDKMMKAEALPVIILEGHHAK